MGDNAKAAGLVNIIRDIVDQKLNDNDQTVTCMIESVNANGTLNVFILPDTQTVISNIINESRYNFNKGDYALLYLIKGRVSNSFVVCKYNPKLQDEAWYTISQQINNLNLNGMSIDQSQIESLIKTYNLQTKILIIKTKNDLPIVGGNYLYIASETQQCYIYDNTSGVYITVGIGFDVLDGGNANG